MHKFPYAAVQNTKKFGK